MLNHKWCPDVVLKQDKPDFLQLDLFGLPEISLIIENHRKFFAMTFTTDTSGCERLISLMNGLQAEFQPRMEHDHNDCLAHILGMASGLAEDGSPLEQES